MLFAQRLRAIRNAKSLNQKEFADLIEINPVTLSHYENEKREPDLDRLASLCQKLNVSADYLLGLTDNEIPLMQEKSPISSILDTSTPRNPLGDLHPPYLDAALDFIEYQHQKQQAAELSESKTEAK